MNALISFCCAPFREVECAMIDQHLRDSFFHGSCQTVTSLSPAYSLTFVTTNHVKDDQLLLVNFAHRTDLRH
jgi:hypothetical protein